MNTEALGVARAEVLRLSNRIGLRESLELLSAFAEKVEAGDRFPGVLTIADIQAAVCRRYDLLPIDMRSARRAREVARPRQVAMYLARRMTARSLPEIGRRFGNRDHSTILHGIRQIERLRKEDPDLNRDVTLLEQELTR